MGYQSVNPFTNTVTKSFDEITDSAFETKLAAADACYESWRHVSYADRAVIIARAAVLLTERATSLAQTMTLEMGKRINEALGEVAFSARIMAYYAKNAEQFLAPVKLHRNRSSASTRSTGT